MALLLDTHTLIWMDSGSDDLGPRARQAIQAAAKRGEAFVSPISFWEAGLAIRSGRLKLKGELAHWASAVMNAGYRELPIKTRHTVLMSELAWRHRDPADRLLVATAHVEGLTLVTADEKILGWSGDVERMDARV